MLISWLILLAQQVGSYISILYGPLIFAAKLLILLQFKNLFVPRQRSLIYWFIQLLIWSNLIFYLIDTFVLAFACTPRTKIWDPSVPGHCLNYNLNYIITGAWNIFSDFSILLLPLYSIWQLQLPMKKKLDVSAIFATGLLYRLWETKEGRARELTFGSACITSILRLLYTIKLLKSPDVTYALLGIDLWTFVLFQPLSSTFCLANSRYSFAELMTVILCGTLPVLSKLLQFLSTRKTNHTYKHTLDDSPHTAQGILSKFSTPSISTRTAKTRWPDPEDPTAQLIYDNIAMIECKAPEKPKPRDSPYSVDDEVGNTAPTPLAGIVKTIRVETEAGSNMASSHTLPKPAYLNEW